MRELLSSVSSGLAILALSAGTAMAGSPAIRVPEPSSLALIAIGIAGVAWVKFGRRK